MSTDLRKATSDTLYTAIGFGVVGYQQARVRIAEYDASPQAAELKRDGKRAVGQAGTLASQVVGQAVATGCKAITNVTEGYRALVDHMTSD